MKHLKVNINLNDWEWSYDEWDVAERDSFINWLRNEEKGRLELTLAIIKLANSVEQDTYTQEYGEKLYLDIVNRGARRYIKSQGMYTKAADNFPKLLTVAQLFDAKTRKGIAWLLLRRYQLEVNSLLNYRRGR